MSVELRALDSVAGRDDRQARVTRQRPERPDRELAAAASSTTSDFLGFWELDFGSKQGFAPGCSRQQLAAL